jgi:hypothetical protein
MHMRPFAFVLMAFLALGGIGVFVERDGMLTGSQTDRRR